VDRHNSCANTKAIIEYITRHHGSCEELLQGLEDFLRGVNAPVEFLCDPHNWVSSDVCRVMYANARKISGNEKVAYLIGFESVTHQSLGYIQQLLLKALGGPKAAVSRAKNLNEKFNRNKQVEIIKLAKNEAVVRLTWDKHLELNRDFCLVNQGIYSALATLWGVPPARVQETRCQFDGDDFCEFHLSWQNPSTAFRLRHLFSGRRKLLSETLAEVERDKLLLERKHGEVQALNADLQGKIDQLLSLQQASAAILAQLNLKELLPSVLDLFRKAIGYSRAMIMLRDESGNCLRFVEGVGVTDEEKEPLLGYEVSLNRTQNLLARVASSGMPFICNDPSKLKLNPQNLIIRNYNISSMVILPLMSRGKVIGILAADQHAAAGAHKSAPKLDQDFLGVFANQIALAIENAKMYQDLRDSILGTMKALALALEAKDPYTAGHSERVRQMAARLGGRLGMDEEKIQHIANGCILHDIGKIGINREILNKPGKLESEEMEVVRQHPRLGHAIVLPLGLNPAVSSIVRLHHECYDGSGYPDGLAGEDIPQAVRVVAICDAFDAMTSDRPYRHSLPRKEAFHRLQEAAGSQFDPYLVKEFTTMGREEGFDDMGRPMYRPGENHRIRVVGS
jgi:HD-GYP domain-containing protein (c-di-GMP phosphodiesterase class II)